MRHRRCGASALPKEKLLSFLPMQEALKMVGAPQEEILPRPSLTTSPSSSLCFSERSHG